MLNFRKTTSFLNACVHVFNVNSFLLWLRSPSRATLFYISKRVAKAWGWDFGKTLSNC